MPPFGPAYSDPELAAAANYVIAHFGGKAGRITPEDVAKRRREERKREACFVSPVSLSQPIAKGKGLKGRRRFSGDWPLV